MCVGVCVCMCVCVCVCVYYIYVFMYITYVYMYGIYIYIHILVSAYNSKRMPDGARGIRQRKRYPKAAYTSSLRPHTLVA